ncbi:hypothetical protein [Mesorhizobium sp. M7A.F.Ca.MR.362.00.0.0]|nr:hypothetical protein [Mesorhizobium sp. M7A.F.Ca.MR.362.00.0.0]
MKSVAIGLAAGIIAILLLTILRVPGADLWGALFGIGLGLGVASRTKRTT